MPTGEAQNSNKRMAGTTRGSDVGKMPPTTADIPGVWESERYTKNHARKTTYARRPIIGLATRTDMPEKRRRGEETIQEGNPRIYRLGRRKTRPTEAYTAKL